MATPNLVVRIPPEEQPLVRRVVYRFRDDPVFRLAVERILEAAERDAQGRAEIMRRAHSEAAGRLLETSEAA